MKKPVLMAAVAAISLLAAASARADEAAVASGSQIQTNASPAPVQLDASTASVIPDNQAIRGQVTAHRTDDGDIGSPDDEDDDSKDKQ